MTPAQQAALEEELALEEEVALERARTSFEGFYRYINPGHEVSWHHRLIFRELDRLVSGENKRLIITLPPRHGKSESVSRLFPAYMMGLEPDKNIIACSYATPLAQRMSRDVQRIMDEPAYQRVFPHIKLWGKNVRSIAHGSYLRNSDIFEVVNHRGAYRAAGLGAGITGMGMDCIHENAVISTDIGNIEIKHLALSKARLVWAYNHAIQKAALCRVQAIQAKPASELVSVAFSSGRCLRVTPEHRIFIQGQGYRPAGTLTPGDCVIALDKGAVLPLRQKERQGVQNLPAVLSAGQGNMVPPEVYAVRQKVLEAKVRLRKILKKRHGRGLLRQDMCSVTSLHKKSFKVPNVQAAIVFKLRGLVFTYLQEKTSGSRTADKEARHVGCSRPAIQKDANFDFGTRQKQVPRVRKEKLGYGAPYKSRPARQQSAQSDHSLHPMPCPYSSGRDFVASITRESPREQLVYDLQVEGCHNFFAEGILVHNCGIIDDPVKDAADAMSSTIQDSQWEWYASTFRSRLAKGGRIAILATRWVFNDIIGRLIDLAAGDPNADQWRVIKLPAINETGPTDDDPRQPGEALWPDFFPVPELEKQRATNNRQFEALYQCNPVPLGGNIVNDSWWREWQPAELPRRFEKVIISADLTFKGSSKGDWTVMMVMAKHQGRCYILDMVRRQVPFTGQQAALLWLYNDAMEKYGVREVIVEDAANGAAIIDQLRSKIPCLIPVRAGDASKEARAQAVTPIIEAGNVLLPCPTRAAWVQQFRTEWAQFPMAAHDDIVDAATYGISRLFPPRMSMLGAMPMGVAKISPDPMFGQGGR